MFKAKYYMDAAEWDSYRNWAFMPKLVLVKIFEYLSWRDRAHAALTCKRWLNSFCAPDVWRSFTYHPPAQGLTRLQYDLKTYFLGRGIRIIGWHFQYLRFPETEDYFMLNRVLSLIAEFFEAHPNPHNFSSNSLVSTEILFPELAALEANLSSSPSNASPESSGDEEEKPTKSTPMTTTDEEIPWGILAEAVDGDPELEKTIKLAMKLQRKEYERGTSSSSSSLNSSSSSESGIGVSSRSRGEPNTSQLSSSVPIRLHFRSASTTAPPSTMALTSTTGHAPGASGGNSGGSKGRKYQRSVSCKFPCSTNRLPYPPDTSNLPPPCIRSFSLDFHAEFDEGTGIVYGSGGALFATIVRVLSQLKCLRRLYLRNLFLSQHDARQLLIEVSTVAGPTLERVSLLHVCKINHERHNMDVISQDEDIQLDTPSIITSNTTNTSEGSSSDDVDKYWYLKDPRWLGAKPRLLGWNPLADIFALFPNLSHLEIALTQLTGPMLLRLIYQTQLTVLILTQTDLSPRWMEYLQNDEGSINIVSREGMNAVADQTVSHTSDEYFVDWGADVPVVRHGTAASSSDPPAAMGIPGGSDFWCPVAPELWRRAILMRPSLRVHVRLRFLYSRATSELNVLALPTLPAPLVSIVCVFGCGDQMATYRLIERAIPHIAQHANTLLDVVLLTELDLEAVESEEREKEQLARLRGKKLVFSYQNRQKRRQITPTKDIVPQALDEQLINLLNACPNVSSLSIGGRLLNVHLTTASQICRLLVKAARASPRTGPNGQKPALYIDAGSIRYSGPIPESASERDSSIFLELMRDCRGKEVDSPAAKQRAAECLIAATLGSPKWHFLQTEDFRRHVLNYPAV